MFLSDQLERILRYVDRFACLFHVYELWLYYSVYFLKGVGGLDPLISGVIVDGRSRRR